MYDPDDYTLAELVDIATKLKIAKYGNKTVLLGRIAETVKGRQMLNPSTSKRQKTSDANDEESDEESGEESGEESDDESDDDDINFKDFYEKLAMHVGKDKPLLNAFCQKYAVHAWDDADKCAVLAELMCFDDSSDIDDDTTFDFNEFLKRLSLKLDRQLINKALRKYYPSVSVEKITKLSKGGALTELAQIMCYEEED